MPTRLFRRCFALLALILLAATVPAQAQPKNAPQYSAVRLISPVTAVGSDAAIPAALEITMTDGWKTYWRTPGDAGLAPVIDSAGSDNVGKIDILYPAPHRFTIFDIDNFGYKDKVTLPLEIAAIEPGQAMAVRLQVDLLVCDDICVPESHAVSLALPAGVATASPDAAAYAAAVMTVPARNAEGLTLHTAYLTTTPDNRSELVVSGVMSTAPAAEADLFVETPGGEVSFLRPTISYDDKTGDISLRAIASSTQSPEKIIEKLSQKDLTLTYVDANRADEVVLPLSPTPATAQAATVIATAPEAERGLSLDLLFYAFLGGLILNLMPCVLPVLSLKVISVLNHGGAKTDARSRHKIFVHFMASAAGIITSFWLLAGGLVGLKLAGESVGWGIQFQHPGFLIFLIVVLLAFALNMWGLYEIPLPRWIAHRVGRKSHDTEPTLIGDFLTGAFATLLATPCTAPFLGTAIGFALAGSSLDIFAIFTLLGIGLAAPYILLALLPGLFKYLPRPGKWMLHLRRVMAFALVTTAIWLAGTLHTIATQPTLDVGWGKFDQSLIAPAVAEGKTVFVDITADWCITCKANKRIVIDTADVQAALNQPHIIKLQGDWTQQDETIATYLRSFGKFGIPFNVVYGPSAPNGIVLPELLSKRAVTDALIMATGE